MGEKKKLVLFNLTIPIATEVPEGWDGGWTQIKAEMMHTCLGNVIPLLAEQNEKDDETNTCSICFRADLQFVEDLTEETLGKAYITCDLGLRKTWEE